MARTVPAPEAFPLSVRLRPGQTGWAGLCFGLDGKTGWAMLVSPEKQEAHFLELKNNAVWLDRGMRRQSVVPGREYALRGEYDGSVLRVYFLADPQQKDPWPLFEFPLKLNGQAALYAGRGGAEFSELCVSPLEKPFYTGETFTNPVMVGADPDILLHEGRYYLYNRAPNDPSSSEDAYLYNGSEHAKLDRAGDSRAIFRVTSSTDLVHWSPYKTVFSRDSVLEGAFCMSPNVTEKDGWFYLFFAGGRFRGEENFHIYCASSRSPEGPFTLKSTAPLHTDIEEIGGMPFRDDDGETYLSLVRFDRGNHIWLQKVRLADGVAAADEAPARLILRRTRSPKKRLLCVAGVSTVMEGGLFYCSAHYAVTPSWDPAYVYFDAGNLSGVFGEGLSNDYYSRYPNNLLITLAFSLVFRVADLLRLWGEEYFL